MSARHLVAVLVPLLASFATLGCASTAGPGVAGGPGGCKGEGCGHSGVLGGGTGGVASSSRGSSSTSGGGASSGGTTNATGTTTVASGGSSGGTTGAGPVYGDGNCPMLSTLPDGGGCPNGAYVAQVVDFFTCAPIAGATIQAIDANGVPAVGTVTSAADGTFVLCDPPNSAFTPVISAPTYATVYYPEFQAGSHHVSGISLPPANIVAELTAAVPGGVDPRDGVVLGVVEFSNDCGDVNGWTFTLDDVDGGAVPDGGALVVYLNGSDLPDPALPSTSNNGLAFIYDIDLSATNFFSVSPSNPSAGACAYVFDPALYTGRLFVTTGGISFDGLKLP